MAEREKMPAASSGGNGGAGAAGAPKGGDLSHDNKDLTGLTQAAAEERLREDGLNEIPEEITPYWLMLLKQFYGPMPMAIALAGIISIATVQYDDFAIIFGLLFIVRSSSEPLVSPRDKYILAILSFHQYDFHFIEFCFSPRLPPFSIRFQLHTCVCPYSALSSIECRSRIPRGGQGVCSYACSC